MDLDVFDSDGRSEINEDNEGGEFGVIEKVSIKNLMCHTNLKFSFCPNVNYILGRNGSGKSAVLAAIMIALGGKVVSTGRGLNVKNIIQKGKQAAKVAVTLRNTGPGAFCPELYGDSLTIERRLTIDGTSTYKIKNSSGQTVSSKKEDLNSILQEFNIQVLNPVAILTQDISRNFLNSKDSGDKYTFFYKATQLKQLEEEYDKINQKRGMAQCALQMKQDALPELNQEILTLGKKLKDRESIAQQRTKLRELENEHAWALVIEKEMIAKDCYTAVEALRRKHEESKEKLEMKKEMYNELVRKANSVEEEKTSLQNDMQCLERQRTESFNQKKELKNEIREIKSRIEQRKNGVKHLENEAQHMFNSIESSKARYEKDLKRKEEERIQEISMHRNRKKELIKNSHDLKSRISDLGEVFVNNKIEIESRNESIRSLKYKIQATEKDLEKMKQYKCNRISAYGSDMPRLMQKIEELSKQHVFHQKPMGPVGLFVKVKDPKWTLAVERCLGGRLHSFLCDNMDDVDKLQEVIQKLNIQKPPAVICSKFIYQVHDVSKNEVKSQKFCSVLQILNETNPVVLNHLIDYKYIENIILVENNAEARQIMMHEKEVPMNCSGAYTLSGNNVCPAPNFAFYSNKFRNSTLLSANAYSNNEMRLKENELEKLKITKRQVEEEKDKLNREMMIQFKSRTRNLEELSNLEKKISEEYALIKELENCEESNYIALLRDEFQKLQENLEAKRNKMIEDENSLRILNAKVIDVENNIKEVKEKYDAKFSEINKLTNESLRSNLHTLRILQHEKVQLENRCNKYLQDYNDLNEEYLKKQEDANEDSKRAECLSTRIDTSRKPEVIQHLIKQRKDLLKRNDGFECIEEIQYMFNKKKADYKKAERHITEINSFLKKLRHLMSQRLSAFKIIQSHVSLRVRYLFTTNLDCQKFAGKLIFDHEKRTLDVYAQPISYGNTTSKSTKSLSGGERSFTTVALMLALWDAVEIPFKILDEYDVFMDQVNRKHCMDLMLRTALEHGRDQFIFLSPLQPSEFESSEKIKILYMPEPKRSSTQDESMRVENLLF